MTIGIIIFLALGAYNSLFRPVMTNPLTEQEAQSIAVKDKKKWLPSPQILQAHVQALSAILPPRNGANVKSLDRAADYISKQLKSFGLTVIEQKFTYQNQEYKNLIVEFGPKTGPIVVVGAHYDVCENQPGADDNGSGVAGLIELARLLKKHPELIRDRVQLVAFTLEEPPYYDTKAMGSYQHAESLSRAKETVKLMMSLEMIGYFKDEEGSQTFPIPLLKLDYPTTGNFISIVSNTDSQDLTKQVKMGLLKHSDIPVFSINAPELIPGIDYSDHRSYWQMGFPAMMITDTSFYRNFNYHKVTDVPESLDYKRMAEVVSGVAGVLHTLE